MASVNVILLGKPSYEQIDEHRFYIVPVYHSTDQFESIQRISLNVKFAVIEKIEGLFVVVFYFHGAFNC